MLPPGGKGTSTGTGTGTGNTGNTGTDPKTTPTPSDETRVKKTHAAYNRAVEKAKKRKGELANLRAKLQEPPKMKQTRKSSLLRSIEDAKRRLKAAEVQVVAQWKRLEVDAGNVANKEKRADPNNHRTKEEVLENYPKVSADGGPQLTGGPLPPPNLLDRGRPIPLGPEYTRRMRELDEARARALKEQQCRAKIRQDCP
jgi:hypothetical protein